MHVISRKKLKDAAARNRDLEMPLDAWFRGGAGDLLADTLSPDRVRLRGWFRPEAVADLISAHRSGEAKFSNRLYALFNLELWAQEYLS